MQTRTLFTKSVAMLMATLMVMPVKGAEVVTFFHNDISGSPMMATDAGGAVLWKEAYKPYGEKLNRQSASASNKIGFHGKPFDDNSGLSYMSARYYDPVIGRFTGIDPVGFQEGNLHSFNRYNYANNNPYRYVDPDGRNAAFVGVVLGALGLLGLLGATNGGRGFGTAPGKSGGGNDNALGGTPSSGGGAARGWWENITRNDSSQDDSNQNANTGGETGSGSYTNTHESGKTYHGKGGKDRSQESGKEKEKKYGDKHIATDWTPAPNDREAFKDEARRLEQDGGHRSDSNYNQRASPGSRYIKQDRKQ